MKGTTKFWINQQVKSNFYVHRMQGGRQTSQINDTLQQRNKNGLWTDSSVTDFSRSTSDQLSDCSMLKMKPERMKSVMEDISLENIEFPTR
jgi:hypothetical protein